jgi:hypothetical protein
MSLSVAVWMSVMNLSRADIPTSARDFPKAQQNPEGDTSYQFPPRVEFDNYKASYFMCDERCRDLGNRNHVARTFAEPTEHGQCRHHRVAFQ